MAIDLFTITAGDGSQGFVLQGGLAGDRSGFSVASAGDVNGDGFDDLMVGAPFADGPADGRSYAGDSYVIFGKAGGFTATIDLAAVTAGDGSQGFVLQGELANDRSGYSVSSAGDVNGDGFDDLIVGAPLADGPADGRNYAGDSYVIFGKASGFTATIDLAAITAGDGSQGFVLQGELAVDLSGFSVSSAGDVNGDGFDDLIVGAFRADGPADGRSYAGDSYVVFGKAGGFAATIDLAAIAAGDGSRGFVLQGELANDQSGFSVASAGDVNGDGFDDLIVGAPYADGPADGRSEAGDSYVVFGKAGGFAAAIDLAAITAGDGSQGFVLQGELADDQSGFSVASAGDVNGDGFDDLIVGARNADGPSDGRSLAGDSYVIFGKAGGFAAAIDLAAITAGDGSQGFVLQGELANDRSGYSVASAGDVNGDGFDDLIVGASFADGPADGRIQAGDSYVIFGKAGGFTAAIDLAAITAGNGSQGFVLQGELVGDFSGRSVASAGDVNGDGFDDLMVGAPLADGPADGRPIAGDSYVIFGSATIDGSASQVTHLGGDGDQTLIGDAAANVMVGGRGNDLLAGLGGADSLRGGEGNDVLGVFDAGFHRVSGGTGFDTLFLAGAMTVTDADFRRVEGIEEIMLGGEQAVNLTLGAIAAHAVDGLAANDFGITVNGLSGSVAHVIDGSALDRPLLVNLPGISGGVTALGGKAADNFAGGGGGDALSGGAGNDTLSGGAGGDALIGGAGADTMTGGSEGDIYFVRQAGDVVVELAGGGGRDRVAVSLSYALDPGAEIEMFTTTSSLRVANFNLTGNEFSQQIFGNAGANILDGAGGNDSLYGGLGDDTLIGGTGVDALQGGSGSDTASYATATARVVASLANPSINTGDAAGDTYKSVENLTGSSFNDALNGTNGTNIVNGVAGNDFIKGYGGNDALTGGAGEDTFIFNTALDAATNIDTISDFNVADDTVQLDNVVFATLVATGALASGFFRANATGTAQDSNDHIVYETDTGKLFYDANGNGAGAAIQFATLAGNPAITAADFQVV